MKRLILAIAFIFITSPASAIDVHKAGNTYVVTPSATQIDYWEAYGGAAAVQAELEDWDGKVRQKIDAETKASLNDQCAGLSDVDKAKVDALLTGAPCASAVDGDERL
jgi:virulence-associated protein VagC